MSPGPGLVKVQNTKMLLGGKSVGNAMKIMRNRFERGSSFIPMNTLLVRVSIPGSQYLTCAVDKDQYEVEVPVDYEVCFEPQEEEIRYTRISWEDVQTFVFSYVFQQSPSKDSGSCRCS